MHSRERGYEIDEAVRRPPSRRTQLSERAMGRGCGKGDQAAQADEADRKINPLDDLAPHFEQIEMLIEDVKRKVKNGVGGEATPRVRLARVSRE